MTAVCSMTDSFKVKLMAWKQIRNVTIYLVARLQRLSPFAKLMNGLIKMGNKPLFHDAFKKKKAKCDVETVKAIVFCEVVLEVECVCHCHFHSNHGNNQYSTSHVFTVTNQGNGAAVFQER